MVNVSLKVSRKSQLFYRKDWMKKIIKEKIKYLFNII